MSKPFSKKPLQDAPNGINALRILRGLSTYECSRRIYEQSGVLVPASQIRRAERAGGGLGGARWRLLATVLGVEAYQLYDPNIAQRLSVGVVKNYENNTLALLTT